MGKRIAMTSAVVGAIVCALAAPAAAHVTIDPPSAPQGSTTKLSFLVPNEEPAARVNKVQIAFPTPPDTPIASVAVGQKPGWNVNVTKQRLAQPLHTDDGTINQVVSLVQWTAMTPADAIPPGQFGEFTVDADGLPDDGDRGRVPRDPDLFERHRGALDRSGHAERPRGRAPHTGAAAHPGRRQRARPSRPPPRSRRRRRTAPRSSRRRPRTTARVRSAIVALALGAVALILATGALMRRRRA